MKRAKSTENRVQRTEIGSGLTLIELMVTVVLISALLGAIWVVYNTTFKVFYGQWARIGVKGEMGSLFVNIANELRQATSITTAQATNLEFNGDINGDGTAETIQYSWSGVAGAPLVRTQTVPAPTLTKSVVHSVNSLAFAYYNYDQNTTPLSFPVTLANVKLVAIDVTGVESGETFRLRSKVKLSNI